MATSSSNAGGRPPGTSPWVDPPTFCKLVWKLGYIKKTSFKTKRFCYWNKTKSFTDETAYCQIAFLWPLVKCSGTSVFFKSCSSWFIHYCANYLQINTFLWKGLSGNTISSCMTVCLNNFLLIRLYINWKYCWSLPETWLIFRTELLVWNFWHPIGQFWKRMYTCCQFE